ncbi:hypothetical protein OIV83_006336 [Microbotryomycetes sp. JL201]|nr:hypothetical protein OIV83_006336 [Microbotryomycetes sp. JL201]
MGVVPQFALPSWPAFTFVPFYIAQALLLQPSIAASLPPRLLTTLRWCAGAATFFLAAVAPFWWRVQPIEWSIGANFRFAIFGPNFMLKAIEFATRTDLERYKWIGFDDVAPSHEADCGPRASVDKTRNDSHTLRRRQVSGRAKTSQNGLYTPPESPVLRAVAQSAESEAKSATVAKDETVKALNVAGSTSFWTAFKDAMHLVMTFRGVGYAFGPKPNSLPTVYFANDRKRFLWRSFKRLVRSHIISNVCTILMIHRHDRIPVLVHGGLSPFVTLDQSRMIANVLSYLAVGISLHAQMLIGFEGSKLILGLPSLITWPNGKRLPFDEREWADLFWMPFLPENVSTFWSKQSVLRSFGPPGSLPPFIEIDGRLFPRWHHLFRDPFTAVGFEPVSRVIGSVFGKTVGRAAGVVTVFALSSWLHDQALFSARWKLDPGHAVHSLSFTERWGGWIFFMAQAVAVIIEAAVSSLSRDKKRLSGWHWRVWSYFWIVGVGCLAGRSWLAMGLASGLPPIDQWTWQRFVIPSFSLAPPPIFVKQL